MPDSFAGNNKGSPPFEMLRSTWWRGGDGARRASAASRLLCSRWPTTLAIRCSCLPVGVSRVPTRFCTLARCAFELSIVSIVMMLCGRCHAFPDVGVTVRRRFLLKDSTISSTASMRSTRCSSRSLSHFWVTQLGGLPNYLMRFRWLREAEQAGGVAPRITWRKAGIFWPAGALLDVLPVRPDV